MQAGVDEDRAGAGVADQEGGTGTVIGGLPVISARSSFRVSKRPPGRSIIARGHSTVAGDQRFDGDGRPRRSPGERLVQGLCLHLDLHRE